MFPGVESNDDRKERLIKELEKKMQWKWEPFENNPNGVVSLNRKMLYIEAVTL